MLLTMFTNTCTVAKCILNHGRLEPMTNKSLEQLTLSVLRPKNSC